MTAPEPLETVQRLQRAVNEHDLESLVGCFSPDYRNETPVHPARGFSGRDQVRDNWRQFFRFVPDITAKLIRSAVDGDTVWTEWEHHGTRADGSEHHMRGVVIFGIAEGVAIWGRFYLEPVEHGGADVNVTVRNQVGAHPS
jgi:ketosteroid isomerase-like protein